MRANKSTNIPILMYHQVSSVPHPNFLDFTVTTQAFSHQMRLLKFLGFQAVSLARLLACKEERGTMPAKPVIITFDDALFDAIENAVPILERMGFPAVFYVTTEYVGKKSSWMVPEVEVEFPVASWEKIKALDIRNFEIGAHTISHPRLSKISEKDCYEELHGSRQKLEEILEHEVKHLAYPFGDYNERVKMIARETGYDTACTTEKGTVTTTNDMFALPRWNMGMDETILSFLSKISSERSPIGILTRNLQLILRKLPRPIKKIIKGVAR